MTFERNVRNWLIFVGVVPLLLAFRCPGAEPSATARSSSTSSANSTGGGGAGGETMTPNSTSTAGGEAQSVTSTGGSGGGGGGDPGPCDGGIPLEELDATVAAKAIGLCDVLGAAWTMADGSPATMVPAASYHLGHGVMNQFGANVFPREGGQMLAISSGTARSPGDLDYQDPIGFDKMYQTVPPDGIPQEPSVCPSVVYGNSYDDIALEVTVKAPNWAEAFSFDSNYFTYEWPSYVCNSYVNPFVALMYPASTPRSSSNVIFDNQGDFIGSHTNLITVCDCANEPPCNAGGLVFACGQGSNMLLNTGYEGHAATGWMQTVVPITLVGSPGSDVLFTVRFATYDIGDGAYDSLVLIDNWQWVADFIEHSTTPAP